jgi:hypothetical protein
MVLAVSLWLQLAPVPVAAAFATACQAPVTEDAGINRLRGTPDLKGVIGDSYIRTLRFCTSATEARWDRPRVLAAWMEGPASGQGVGLGFTKCGRPAGITCSGVPNDGAPHFIYTPADNNFILSIADGWYGGAPIVGHAYRFRITWHNTLRLWQYCIRDKNTGEGYRCVNGTTNTWSAGDFASWFPRVSNPASQFGTAVGEPELELRWLQYLVGGTWFVVSDQGSCVFSATFEPYYHCLIVSTVDVDGDGIVNDRETIRGNTSNH